MKLKSYKYKTADSITNGRAVIESIDRSKYTSQVLSQDIIEYMKDIKTNGKTAVLIAGGPAIHHSDARIINGLVPDGLVVVKSQLGYNTYSIMRFFTCDIEYASINTNTCASSMYCLYEAERLMNEGYTDVIVVAIDVVDETQELLFKQLGINLICGDCMCVAHLTKDEGVVSISDTAWKWNNDKSPMSVSTEGYKKVIDSIDTKEVDLIKMHGSGTERNTMEEHKAIEHIECRKIEYKSEIGHTQGASSIVEICMMVDREEFSKAMVLASGLGGFYGGCIVSKE